MSATSDFYLARAAECAREADSAVLSNVRERSLRARSAWLSMFDRVERGEALRERAAADKAEKGA
jgi:hypothetical protein